MTTTDPTTEMEQLLRALFSTVAPPPAPIAWDAGASSQDVVPRARVLAGGHPTPARRRRRRVVAGLGAAAVALSLVAVTPAGAAIARTVLPKGIQQRLGLFEGAPTQLSAPGGLPAGSGGGSPTASPMPCSQVPAIPPYPQVHHAYDCYPDLSLAAAQRQVDFSIPTPAALPGGLSYRGALVGIAMGDPKNSVLLTYRDTSGKKSLGLEVVRGTPGSGSGVPSGSVQRVKVDGSPAYYVHGSYGDDGPGTSARWHPGADDEELTWQHGGFTYDLTTAGLHYSSADLIRIAESVR
jgi:hypothetical protein